MKKCIKCKEGKSIDQYILRSDTGKRVGICNDCRNKRSRDRHKEKMGGSTKREQRATVRESDPKVCIKCDQSKPLSEFNWHNREKDQHRNFCKECQNAWARKRNKTSHAKNVRKRWEDENADRIQEYKNLYKKLDESDPARVENRRAYSRMWGLKKQFALTPDQYKDMLDAQGGKCLYCESTDPGNGRENFAVDHCHDTGKVRGILCFKCNVAIGLFQDNPDILIKAAEHLKKFKS